MVGGVSELRDCDDGAPGRDEGGVTVLRRLYDGRPEGVVGVGLPSRTKRARVGTVKGVTLTGDTGGSGETVERGDRVDPP